MRRIGGLAALALLAGCATPVATPPATARWDSIAFEVKSWGRPIMAWTVSSDGTGTWSQALSENDSPRGAYRIEHHAIAPGPQAYRELAAGLEALPDPAPSTHDCVEYATDFPYGTLTLTAAGTAREVTFNDGCRDADYRRFMQVIRQADDKVGEWGRAAPVSRTEAVTE